MLSAAKLDALTDLSIDGDVHVREMRGRFSKRTLDSLEDDGLLELGPARAGGAPYYRLTDAGAEALDET